MKAFSLNSIVCESLKERVYGAVDRVFLIMCSFIDGVTGYKKCSKIRGTFVTCASLMNIFMASGWRRVWTDNRLKELGSEVYVSTKEVGRLFSYSFCTSKLYTMKVHLLDHFVYDFRIFEHITVLDAFFKKQFNVYIKSPYRVSCRRRAGHTQGTVILIERQERSEGHRMSTEEISGLQSVVDRRAFRCTEQCGGIL